MTAMIELRDAAVRGGMRTLAEDGWRLVRMGLTTVEEVLSVTTAKEVAASTKSHAQAAEHAKEQAAEAAASGKH